LLHNNELSKKDKEFLKDLEENQESNEGDIK
jgi:hypothetical protein